ncbi:unnamed protein product [Urochloa decumbens]|uniref:Acidic protein n=1 Tax=Urochloa decumbens TaxID=240449 RepID=A0ABC9FSU6_9POAL
MGSKGLNCVLLCVLMLGLVLEQARVEGKSCCKTTTARNCYNVCRLAGRAQQTCASLCGCKIISGSKCPPDFPKLNFLPSYGEKVKANVERCGYACDRFCNGDAIINTPVAE